MPEPVAPGLTAAHPGDALPASAKRDGSFVAEKAVCSGSGVSCYIVLAEPTIFLTGLDHDASGRETHHTARSSAMLRGIVRLNVSKSAKIKAVTLKFTGKARTEWPEGKRVCGCLSGLV